MPASAGDVVRNLRFLLESRSVVPPANLRRPRDLYRALAIERSAAEIVEAEDIDVIHSHFGWPGSFGGVLARAATGRPLIACLRGADVLVDRGRRLRTPEPSLSRPHHPASAGDGRSDAVFQRLHARDRRLAGSAREPCARRAEGRRSHAVHAAAGDARPSRPQAAAVPARSSDDPDGRRSDPAQGHPSPAGGCRPAASDARLQRGDLRRGRGARAPRGASARRWGWAIAPAFAGASIGRRSLTTSRRAMCSCWRRRSRPRATSCSKPWPRPDPSSAPRRAVRPSTCATARPVSSCRWPMSPRSRRACGCCSTIRRWPIASASEGLRLAQDGYGFDRMTGDIVRLYHDVLAERRGPRRGPPGRRGRPDGRRSARARTLGADRGSQAHVCGSVSALAAGGAHSSFRNARERIQRHGIWREFILDSSSIRARFHSVAELQDSALESAVTPKK